MQASWNEQEIADLGQKLSGLTASMSQVIVGQKDVIDSLVICLIAGGHALLEGVPGLGKTLLVKSLAQATDLQFRRVQFTPDLMPSDIVGTEILEEIRLHASACFVFNRARCLLKSCWPMKLIALLLKRNPALLEAMQERSVTFAGQTHRLPQPFLCWPPKILSNKRVLIPCPKRSSIASYYVSMSATRARKKRLRWCPVRPTQVLEKPARLWMWRVFASATTCA